MPRTTAQQERSLQDPAVCELLKIRDFLDNVMVRTDGCYVAGFRVQGSVTYFADDEGRNEAKGVVESLLRAMPEQSMRVQFRYEVVESLNGLLDQYRDASRSETPEVKVLDDRRLATWEEKERLGAYLSRISGVYLIWDPVKHKRAMIASSGLRAGRNGGKPVGPSRCLWEKQFRRQRRSTRTHLPSSSRSSLVLSRR
jgi:hypothetical protein